MILLFKKYFAYYTTYWVFLPLLKSWSTINSSHRRFLLRRTLSGSPTPRRVRTQWSSWYQRSEWIWSEGGNVLECISSVWSSFSFFIRSCHSYLGFHILLLAVGHVGHVGTLGCVSGTNFEGKIRKLGWLPLVINLQTLECVFLAFLFLQLLSSFLNFTRSVRLAIHIR